MDYLYKCCYSIYEGRNGRKAILTTWGEMGGSRMKLTSLCYICQKPLVLVNECQNIPVPDDTRRTYNSCTGIKAAFDFQREGIDFVFKSNFHCLIADPMG